MELVLTGLPTTATNMERFGIVNKVVAADQDVVEEAVKVAEAIAALSSPAVGLAKQAVKAGQFLTRCTPLPKSCSPNNKQLRTQP
jgi:enoyl-CoA hydratase